MTDPAERPAGLPENFNSVEALAQSYKELQGRFTQQQQGVAPPPQAPPQPAPAPPPQAPEPPQAPPNALGIQTPNPEAMGLDSYVSQFSQEWNQNQKLSDASYARIQQDRGLNRQEVDSYIQGRVALQNQVEQAGFAAAGGPDNYKRLQSWAANNLQPHEVAAYNEVMGGGNPFLIQNMVSSMRTRMAQDSGDPALMQAEPGTFSVMNQGDLTPYPSQREMQEDMDKEEYSTDPSFRRKIYQRMAISPWVFEDQQRPNRDPKTFLDGALQDIQFT